MTEVVSADQISNGFKIIVEENTFKSFDVVKSIDFELTKLLFTGFESNADPYLLLADVKKQGPRKVCQYQFKKNDIVWICRQCQRDETCVLCNDCFQGSSHVGHEVYFYHSQSGGCCDCGDGGSWNPKGFCHKHSGQSMSNPESLLPSKLLCTANLLFPIIADYIIEFCESWMQKCMEDDGISVLHERLYKVSIQNDDVHSLESVIEAIATVTGVSSEALGIATKAHKEGRADITGLLPYLQAKEIQEKLLSRNLIAKISDEREVQATKVFLSVIAWLHKIGEAGDGLCRLICNSYTISKLSCLLVTDPYIPKDVVLPLHGMFLTLMADATLKISFSRAYSLACPKVAVTYSKGIGTNENSLFSMSVQFLNRDTYVAGMILEYDYMTTLSNSLLKMLAIDKNKFSESIVIQYRRYTALVGDLKILFTIKDVSRLYLAQCFPLLMDLLSKFQYLHEQKQSLLFHVAFETKEWIHAFNLYLSLASLFDGSINWFESKKSILGPLELEQKKQGKGKGDRSHADSGDNTAEEDEDYNTIALQSPAVLPVVGDVLSQVYMSIVQWVMQFLDGSAHEEIYSLPSGQADMKLWSPPQGKSFHLLLHRYLATCIRESAKYIHLQETLHNFQTFIVNFNSNARSDFESFGLVGLIDFPLLSIEWMSEIRSEMWKRNGMTMFDQILNYGEAPFCRIFKDLDILLIQFAASAYGVNKLINHIISRFNLVDYVANSFNINRGIEFPKITGKFQKPIASDKVEKMFEELIELLIVLVTELPLPPAPTCEERILPLVRREVVHRLVTGPCTYSQLQEAVSIVPETDAIKMQVLDGLIKNVAEYIDSSGSDAPKLRLKESLWDEYDPCFFHLSNKMHQAAMESRPKLKKSQPIVQPPLQAHPSFVSLRVNALLDPLLLSIIRDVLYVYAAHKNFSVQNPHHTAYMCIAKQWLFKSSSSCFSMSLQLLTLVIHNAFVKDEDNNSVQSDVLLPLVQERRDILSRFLLESFEIREESIMEFSSMSPVVFPSVLTVLMDLYDNFNAAGGVDDPNKFWLMWCIEQIEKLSPACENIVRIRMSKELDEKKAKEMQERKNKARERALKAMNNSAKSFAAHINEEKNKATKTDDVKLDEMDDNEDVEKEDGEVCILCRAKSEADVIGFLAFSQHSRVLSSCCQNPSIHLDDEKSNSNPHQQYFHVQFCGHAIHMGCFETFFAGVIEKSELHNGLILDISKGQFQCPLCMKISNCLMPKFVHGDTVTRKKPRLSVDDVEVDIDGIEKSAIIVESANDFRALNSVEWMLQHTNQTTSVYDDLEKTLTDASVMKTINDDDVVAMTKDNKVEDDSRSSIIIETPQEAKAKKLSKPNYFKRFLNMFTSKFERDRASSTDEDKDKDIENRISMEFFDANSGIVEGEEMSSQSLPDPANARVLLHQKTWLRFFRDFIGAKNLQSMYETSRLQEYLFKSIACVAYTVCVDVCDKSPGHHLSQDINIHHGVDGLKYLHYLTTNIGECMFSFGVRDILYNSFRNSIFGISTSKDTYTKHWTSDIIVNVSDLCENPIFKANLVEDWFQQPLLCMPLLDAMVLVVAICNSKILQQDSSRTKENDDVPGEKRIRNESGDGDVDIQLEMAHICNWICIGKLVQLVIAELNCTDSDSSAEKIKEKDTKCDEDLDKKPHATTTEVGSDTSSSVDDIDNWLVGKFIGDLIFSIQNKITDNLNVKTSVSAEKIAGIKRVVVWKWLAFLRAVIQLQFRCKYNLKSERNKEGCKVELAWNIESPLMMDENIVMQHMDVLNITHVFLQHVAVYRTLDFAPDKSSLSRMEDKHSESALLASSLRWISQLDFKRDLELDTINTSPHDVKYSIITHEVFLLDACRRVYPATSAPRFVPLIESYTNLHAHLSTLCGYEYPALCMLCGGILDAGGKGKCALHTLRCGVDQGVYFLLQDCSMLLMYGPRSSYYTAFFVDSHGESHKNFRGKPLHLDYKRLEVLRKMWVNHYIPVEVVQKRSASNRVIIIGHY